MLVNDEPITAYEIQQRTAFLALNAGVSGQDLRPKFRGALGADHQGPQAQRALQQECCARSTCKSREEAHGGTKGVRHASCSRT